VDDMKQLTKELKQLSCVKAAEFIRKHINMTVTFAILALEEKDIPWTSNIIERLMGEISKRCKHKWMKWTTRGLETLLQLLLLQYTKPEKYKQFQEKILKTKTLNNITGEVQIIPA
jgi:transposase-like protein